MLASELREGFIVTFTGKRINPLCPDPELIDPLDIAHSLSIVNRFTGHTYAPLSVAQHSCEVHDILPDEHKLWGLLHDATEAYISDLAKPVKMQDSMEFYREAEDRLLESVAQRFNLKLPLPDPVKKADAIMLYTELRDFLGVSPNGHSVLARKLEAWGWKTSKLNFINRLRDSEIGIGSVLV